MANFVTEIDFHYGTIGSTKTHKFGVQLGQSTTGDWNGTILTNQDGSQADWHPSDPATAVEWPIPTTYQQLQKAFCIFLKSVVDKDVLGRYLAYTVLAVTDDFKPPATPSIQETGVVTVPFDADNTAIGTSIEPKPLYGNCFAISSGGGITRQSYHDLAYTTGASSQADVAVPVANTNAWYKFLAMLNQLGPVTLTTSKKAGQGSGKYVSIYFDAATTYHKYNHALARSQY